MNPFPRLRDIIRAAIRSAEALPGLRAPTRDEVRHIRASCVQVQCECDRCARQVEDIRNLERRARMNGAALATAIRERDEARAIADKHAPPVTLAGLWRPIVHDEWVRMHTGKMVALLTEGKQVLAGARGEFNNWLPLHITHIIILEPPR
jgi:hypothetical protein